MKTLVLCTAAALLALPLAASAAAPQKPGRWETTVTMEMPGMSLPPVTTAVCLTKEDVEHPERALPKLGESGCSVSNYKVTGNTATWSMQCKTPQGSMSGKGSITYTESSYTGSMDLEISGQEMHAKLTGAFKGDCDGTEMKR